MRTENRRKITLSTNDLWIIPFSSPEQFWLTRSECRQSVPSPWYWNLWHPVRLAEFSVNSFTAYTPKRFSRKDASAIYTLSCWLCRVTKLGRKFLPRGRRVKCWREILSLNIQWSGPENSDPDLLLGNFELKIRIPTDTQCVAQFVNLKKYL